MTFDDLKFTNEGCCGTHVWADAVHENGLRTQVIRLAEGGFEVVTWAGNVVFRAAERIADAGGVSWRLSTDAEISL